MEIKGLRTKTFSIALVNGTFTYNLATNRFLGMPENATILTLFIRTPVSYPNDMDIEGRVLSSSMIGYGTINLMSKGGDLILKSIPLSLIADNNLYPFQQTYFKPISNREIDWIGSTIQISTSPGGSTNVPTGEVIEFTVYYTMESNFDFRSFVQAFSNGLQMYGVRAGMVNVGTRARLTKALFKLSDNSSIGLPQNAIIVGYSQVIGELTRDVNNRERVNTATLVSSFLTIQVGSTLVLDALPFIHIFLPYLGIPYFPLPPLPIEYIDWESSKIECSNPSVIENDQSYQLIISYICKE